MKKTHLNQSGAVSMLAVIIFAIILTLVATAYIRSVTSQQRNALNYDLSNRAYYAAESGVQDTIRALIADPTLANGGKNTCNLLSINPNGIVGPDNNYGTRYTCQLITPTPTDIKGEVEPHARNATVRLEPTRTPAGPYRLVVRWSAQQVNPTDQVYYPRATSDLQFSPTTEWYQNDNPSRPIHGLLRVNIISHPKSGALTRANIRQRVVFLNPTASAAASPSFSISSDALEPQQQNLINNAECYPSNSVTGADFDGYSCKQTILLEGGYNLANEQIHVRIGSVYNAAAFSVALTENNGTPITIKNGQAVIDVTGRAGDNVFRRVQQTVSLGGYSEDNFPDAALVGGEGICKLFTISTRTADYLQGCNPLTD